MCFGRFVEDTTERYLDRPDVLKKMGEYYEEDVKILCRVLSVKNIEESELIRIICSRSNVQRQLLKAEYNESYVPRLEMQIAYSFDGELRDLTLGLFMTPSQYKSFCIKEALSDSRRYDEMIMTVFEILISSSPTEIKQIEKAFQQAYEKCLLNELHSETKGYLHELFTFLLCTPRALDEPFVNETAAQVDAKTIEQSHGKELCSFDWKFREIIFILSTRSFAHLLRVVEIFEESTNMDISQYIELNFLGLIKQCLLDILVIAESRPMFFACRLDEAYRAQNTSSKTLRRIIVSRGEVDLDEIMEAYKSQFGKSLDEHVRAKTSGFYKDLLLGLIK